MFEVSSTEVVKMPEMHYLDLSPIVQKRRDRKTSGSPNYHRENHSFTGWTNVNSPNASQIAAQDNDKHAVSNKVVPKNFLDKVIEPEKPEKPESERAVIQSLKRKLWIDVTREKPYEESLRNYPKITIDNPQNSNNRVSRGSKLTTALSRQKSSEFNVVHLYQSTPQPAITNLQPPQQQHRSPKDGLHGVQNIQTIKNPDIAPHSNKISKKNDTNTIFDISNTPKEGNISKIAARSLNVERRSVTALRSRPSDAFNMAKTVVGGFKFTKIENSARKGKNLGLSKALSFWSKVASPAILNKCLTQQDEPQEGKYLDIISSIDLKDLSGYTKTSGSMVPLKMLSFSRNTQEIANREVKNLVPIQHFKPNVRAKKFDEEDDDIKSKMLTSTYDTVKFRTTTPINLYTKAWDTSNGFPRKVSKEFRRKSQLKRRPTGIGSSTELYTSPEVITINVTPTPELRNTIEISGDMMRNTGMSKTYGTSFTETDRTSDYDGKTIRRQGRVLKGSTASNESLKKALNENNLVVEPRKNREVKNFQLFETRT